jgi:hypothetical protein
MRSPNLGQTILSTIVDLRSTNRVATRPVVAEIIGQPMTVVDYHLKKLCSDGLLRRVLNGVFEPVAQDREDRAISFTMLPDGSCKLEVGDVCMELSMREARMVGTATAGVSIQFASAGMAPIG